MSILIRGMEMPNSCRDCMLEQPYDGYNCGINGKSYNWGIEGRPSDCPMVEVPPHGRLIDADALEYSLGIEDRDIYAYHIINDAPTVIEREE